MDKWAGRDIKVVNNPLLWIGENLKTIDYNKRKGVQEGRSVLKETKVIRDAFIAKHKIAEPEVVEDLHYISFNFWDEPEHIQIGVLAVLRGKYEKRR